MKNLFFSLVAILFSTIIYAQDFQPFRIGDSSEKIKAEFDPEYTAIGSQYEGAMGFIMPQKEDETYLIAGVNSSVVYYLLDNKLEGVRFFTLESHDDVDEYMEDYYKINEYLSQKYKKIETREFWEDETYKNDPSKLALAISLGHYSISSTYNDGSTEIVHILKHSNNKDRSIYQMIDYSSEKCMKFYIDNPKNGKDILRRKK